MFLKYTKCCTSLKPVTRCQETLQAYLMVSDANSLGFRADIPKIVQFFPYSLQHISAHFSYRLSDVLLQRTEVCRRRSNVHHILTESPETKI
jgi:hypothetical protein